MLGVPRGSRQSAVVQQFLCVPSSGTAPRSRGMTLSWRSYICACVAVKGWFPLVCYVSGRAQDEVQTGAGSGNRLRCLQSRFRPQEGTVQSETQVPPWLVAAWAPMPRWLVCDSASHRCGLLEPTGPRRVGNTWYFRVSAIQSVGQTCERSGLTATVESQLCPSSGAPSFPASVSSAVRWKCQ